MKIIVNNDSEKELFSRFLDAMHDLDGVYELAKMDSDSDTRILKEDDELFLYQAISESIVVVDNTVEQIGVDDCNLQGICIDCGDAIHGTIDGDDISYEDWLDYTSEAGRKSWKCEECFGKTEVGNE